MKKQTYVAIIAVAVVLFILIMVSYSYDYLSFSNTGFLVSVVIAFAAFGIEAIKSKEEAEKIEKEKIERERGRR